MGPLAAISLLGSGAQALNSLITGFRQKREAKKINPVREDYQISDYARGAYTDAQNRMNSRMPGAAQAERNLFINQANNLGQVSRNAASSAQALGAITGITGATNEALVSQGVNEAMFDQQRLADLNRAREGMTNEYDKRYQDQMNKYQEQAALKQQLLMASQQNKANALGQVTNAAAMGASGMFGNEISNWNPFAGRQAQAPGGGGWQMATITPRSRSPLGNPINPIQKIPPYFLGR